MRPKVFLSYSHDSAEHRQQVLDLSERLRRDGIETTLDRYINGSPSEGWPRWMLNELEYADYVLVVCSETYYRRFRGRELPNKGKGADWEGALITQEIYDDRSTTRKFLPVVFDSRDLSFIPEPLRKLTYYVLDQSYSELYDVLLGQGGIEPGPIGEPKWKPRGSAPTSRSAPAVATSGSSSIIDAGSNAIPFDWVTIPAGSSPMGSDKKVDRGAPASESRHTLHLQEYWIARGPVLVAQFRHFVTANRYRTTAEKQGWSADWKNDIWQPTPGAYWERPHGPDSEAQDDHPVTCVSWSDAIAFCNWAGVRLPTEAEWEKAAAWDSETQTKGVYPWGNEPPTERDCNFNMDIGDTTPVGRYPKGANGLHDMAGNVWEWTSTLYKAYPYEADDRENPHATGERVVRGGSFFQNTRNVRCANRHWHKPDATVSDYGFRCALGPVRVRGEETMSRGDLGPKSF